MFFNDEIGHKYKMSAMQAALGLAQIERVDELVDGKRQIFSWYREECRTVTRYRSIPILLACSIPTG